MRAPSGGGPVPGESVALVRDGATLARVRLPVATIAAEVRAFNECARGLGLTGPSPILAISSLALPVAPFYRLTDRGLVDTLTQELLADALHRALR